jgi:ATP adenylyltransferase
LKEEGKPMRFIWAPWRVQYIRAAKTEGCILCDKPAENADDANRILFRGKFNYVMMNNYPYNPGHLMVIPYRHIANLEDLSSEEKLEHMEIIAKCIKVLKKAYNPAGFNTGMNLGRVAGAGIDTHIHCHVVPRWQGDTNFMPVVGDVRVIPEAVDATYQKMKGEF